MSDESPAPRRRGSHAPSLRTLVRRAMVEHALAGRGDRVLVACSGGPDSTALLHALALLRNDLGIELCAHAVDHGLRTEASRELAMAEALSKKLDVPFTTSTLEVRAGGNLQERARQARHAALRGALVSFGAQHIATGHTANDRAETLLMRVVRGTGVQGLGVIPPRNGPLIRPLFRAQRSDVMLHLERHGLASASDPSNHAKRFLRSRIRHEVLPILEDLSPKVIEAICALADAALELEADPLDSLGRSHRKHLAKALGSPVESRLWLPGGVEAVIPGKRARTPLAAAPKRPPKRPIR